MERPVAPHRRSRAPGEASGSARLTAFRRNDGSAYTYNNQEKIMANLRVILADDHPFVLLGVRSALSVHRDIMIVGEATSPTSLLDLLSTVPCDLLVADLTMPEANGTMNDGLHHPAHSPRLAGPVCGGADQPHEHRDSSLGRLRSRREHAQQDRFDG
jgi:hypothetical protein